MTIPKKGIPQPKPGEYLQKNNPAWIDPEFANNYPTLYAYMTEVEWEGGGSRQTATLTIYVDRHALTVVINDRSNNRSAFINEESLFSALVKIEEGLKDGTIDWRIKRDFRKGANDTPF